MLWFILGFIIGLFFPVILSVIVYRLEDKRVCRHDMS